MKRAIAWEPWTVEEIARAAKGRIVSGRGDRVIRGITLDSRLIPRAGLFVALRGERADGHQFVPAAAASGAAAVMVEEPVVAPSSAAVIRVAETRQALLELSAAYRARFRPCVIGVTGSSGKTSVKNFLHAILKRRHRSHSTPGNFNNEIGVPLTLFGIKASTEYAVVEMGMSGFGEIATLCRLADPAIGVVTSIGPSHTEQVGGVDGVVKAKSELTEYLNARDGVLILRREDPYFGVLRSRANCRVVTVGESEEAEIRIYGIEARGFEPASFHYRGIRVPLRQFGRSAVWNAALAAAAAETAGADPLDIVCGLAECFPEKGRLERRRLRGATVIDDTYNANPLSFRAAIELLKTATANRRIVVMGDMLELGEESDRFHRELGDALAEAGVDILFTRGPHSLEAGAAFRRRAGKAARVHHCAENSEIVDLLDRVLLPGDTLLVKGSRGMRLDEVVEGLVERRTASGEGVVPLRR
ncbi:MAG: UDP-N-acetylmuramoyl-tripeptide--D-alanyl-D-alanine ligase [Candidatus Hydrogenedentota bacterium]|nr:MAG: UDP-N-acetylmuramoyl-tripeptide--D-alanyl-D-alanine ligase [Candidatus Hydrogenedentota bacterium]